MTEAEYDKTGDDIAEDNDKFIADLKKQVTYYKSLSEKAEPVKEETQEELWTALISDWHDVSMNMQEPHILPYLKSKFTITRNK